jgi:ABC-2 type transport system ATP-binding protein
MEIIKAENIFKSYASHVALNDVSIAVTKKTVFGLLGPNGAGKTTLIRLLNQITAPDSGNIYFNGEKLNEKHVEKIGYLPEERGLYKKMKVGEQALYLARLKGMSKAEAMQKLKEWFVRFEIETWWDKKVEELSKGMAQKVQFITTVLHEPELLILDEPFSGFDPINANLIRDEILRLKSNGTTIILSTHNMASVEEICDNIALLNHSKKILDGNVKAIKEKYKSHLYEIVFKGQLLAFTNAMWAGYELIDKKQEEDCLKVTIKMLGNSSVNSLLNAVLPVVEIKSINEILPSMNDIFIKLVTEQNMIDSTKNN